MTVIYENVVFPHICDATTLCWKEIMGKDDVPSIAGKLIARRAIQESLTPEGLCSALGVDKPSLISALFISNNLIANRRLRRRISYWLGVPGVLLCVASQGLFISDLMSAKNIHRLQNQKWTSSKVIFVGKSMVCAAALLSDDMGDEFTDITGLINLAFEMRPASASDDWLPLAPINKWSELINRIENLS